jgi:hypothetical protein
MADLEAYTSVLAVLSAALLLVMAGLAKKQLLWKRPDLFQCNVVAAMPQSRETPSSTISALALPLEECAASRAKPVGHPQIVIGPLLTRRANLQPRWSASGDLRS